MKPTVADYKQDRSYVGCQLLSLEREDKKKKQKHKQRRLLVLEKMRLRTQSFQAKLLGQSFK